MKARIALLPGDGIGREVVAEARRLFEAIGREFSHSFELVEGDIGGCAIEKHGTPLPESTRQLALSSDAVLLGAVGSFRFDHLPPAERPEAGLLGLRSLLGNYANLRPITVWEPLVESSPLRADIVRGVDILIVRELLGGIYFGTPRGREDGRAYNTEVYTDDEIRRVARKAFDLARGRRKKVTSVDKANVLEVSSLWRDIVTEVAASYPDIGLEHLYVDNCAMQLVSDPRRFDVILTNNLFGDILSDEAAVLAGSLGMLPSASIGGPVALYEPVHGSAPDIAGKGIANPIGAIASVAMLLEYSLGLRPLATRIERAISRALQQGYRTADLRGRKGSKKGRVVSTREMSDVICDFVRAADAA